MEAYQVCLGAPLGLKDSTEDIITEEQAQRRVFGIELRNTGLSIRILQCLLIRTKMSDIKLSSLE